MGDTLRSMQNICYAQVGGGGPKAVSEKVHLGGGRTGGEGTWVARLSSTSAAGTRFWGKLTAIRGWKVK